MQGVTIGLIFVVIDDRHSYKKINSFAIHLINVTNLLWSSLDEEIECLMTIKDEK